MTRERLRVATITGQRPVPANSGGIWPLTRRDLTMAAALTAAAVAIAIVAQVAQPGLAVNSSFLFSDQGHNLLVVQTLLSGGRLYRDVTLQYGPIPAYLHAGLASLLGNTPAVYVAYLTMISAVNVALAYVLVRRAANMAAAAFVMVGFIALSVEPGSLIGGYTAAAYLPLERTLLLLIALAWRTPDTRGLWPSLLIGCGLGVWQGVKFGGAVFAGAAVMLIDLAWLLAAGWSARRFRHWTSSLAQIAAGFMAIELIWIVWAFSALKPALAFDVVWPSYMARQYAYAVTPEFRWIPWGGWRLMIAQYLLPASAALVGVAALGRWIVSVRRSTHSPLVVPAGDAGAIFIPLCFFVLAFFFYFRMVHHFRQFMWTLVPAAAWELERRGSVVRAAVAMAWLPGVAIVLKAALIPAVVGPTTAVTLPSGGTIYVSPDMSRRIEFLQRFVAAVPGQPILFLDAGSGWLYAYRVARATRYSWVWAPEIMRPYDEADFIAALDRTAAVIDCQEKAQPGFPVLAYPPRVAAAIRSRIQPWTSGAGCEIYRLRPSS